MIFSGTEAELGSGGRVVVQLCKTVPNPTKTYVYFDNWFTSLDLIILLKNDYGINSLGTVRSNRLQGCTLEQDKSLLKMGRRTFDYKADNNAGIAVVKWADTKCVTLASSYVSHTPTFQVKRYSKEEKKKVDVVCPQIKKQYNTHMGGVDLADMLIALYKTLYETVKSLDGNMTISKNSE
ncbi:piggyBac transposable element-derived protein 2-like [Anthonomus grandis grandis]|uniref:piggyBac transposable element-derived protein 2-like n=1 Tax=Anthonomus grandis grandis TaxID=2921223 RepID=UPI0021659A6A|nr:piggyBac transposable element-derived protein 2-like [Anthonomus grandis grandis]